MVSGIATSRADVFEESRASGRQAISGDQALDQAKILQFPDVDFEGLLLLADAFAQRARAKAGMGVYRLENTKGPWVAAGPSVQSIKSANGLVGVRAALGKRLPQRNPWIRRKRSKHDAVERAFRTAAEFRQQYLERRVPGAPRVASEICSVVTESTDSICS
jgi:hypothetical protein